jgi:hypothetical protein
MLRRDLVSLCSCLLPAALSACGGDDKQANYQQPPPQQCPPNHYFDGQYCQPNQPPPPQQPPPQQQPPPGGPAAAPPPGGIATATPGPAATPADPNAAAAATQALAPLARQHTPPGAKAYGPAIAGQFQQGQSLEGQVQMNPGRCYTIVGAGLPQVTELDIQVLPTMQLPGMGSPVLAQDQTTGSTAVVGGNPNCFKWPAPMAAPVRVVVTVRAGSGPAAAQVYEK